MERISHKKHVAGLATALFVVASIAAVGLVTGLWSGAPPRESGVEADQTASVAFRGGGPDLDGDGRPDSIRAGQDGLQVVSATGGRLLNFEASVLAGYQVASLGGEYPVLFIQTDRGE
ncbi:MAG TPA: hypothetical protein VD902_04675, partial [Symbiobacteriaceae bacterium]|nr:hypothetical protein [Symbiobacteriaceae bacterium]